MKCSACGSEETFFRDRIVLCLKCGATWDRPKVGPSVTDLQLQVAELKSQLVEAIGLAEHYGNALKQIANNKTRNGNQPDMMTYFKLVNIALKALESKESNRE